MKTKFFHFVSFSLLTITLLTISISAASVNLSDYATPDDGLDDSAGFQEAIDDLKSDGGGTITVTSGTWDINTTLDFTTSNNYISFKIIGDKGAVIRPFIDSYEALFKVGNNNQVAFTDLIVLGSSGSEYDAGMIISALYTGQLRVVGCQFLGLRVRDSLIFVGMATDAIIESSQFSGNASDVALIHGLDYVGLTIRTVEIYDYANFKDTYLSKSPSNIGNWIRAESTRPSSGVLANGQRVVRLEDIRMDEAAPQSVFIKNAANVKASGILVRISNTDGAAGMVFENVEFAEVTMSKFGYSSAPRPAIKAINRSKILTSGISVGFGVYYGEADTSSTIFIDERFCQTDCTVRLLGQGTKSKK